MNKNITKNINLYKNDDDDIDLRKYFNIFRRNKLLIGALTSLLTTLGIIYSLIEKPIYRGYFQIIVDERENQNNLIKSSSALESLTNFVGGKNNDNKTQEAILKSPSVLKPVFEFVKEKSYIDNPDIKKMSYKRWLNSFLRIEFEEGTNVLSIKFDNHDKDLIISTLDLISSKYQDYSKKDRERSVINGINYLKSQQSLYKDKSALSLKKLNQFSIDNGLGDIDGFVELGNSLKSQVSQDFGEIIDLDKINFNNRSTNNSSGAGIRYSSQFSLLEKYESQYIDLSSKLKPNSKTLSDLDNRIKNLKQSLKRPNEILLEFRNLKRKASRDEAMLENLEDNLSLLQLEKVKQLTPWQLITDPTIEDSRVSPKRKQITYLTFIVSLIFSFFVALIKERKDNLIYELDDFKKIIPIDIWGMCYKNDPHLNKFILNQFFNEAKLDKREAGLLFLSDKFFEEKEISIPDYIDKDFSFKIIRKNNLKEIDKLKKTIMIAESGKKKFDELRLVISYLKTFNIEIFSWIFIKDDVKNIS